MKKETKEMLKVYYGIFKATVFLFSVGGFFVTWLRNGDLIGVIAFGILMILVCLDNIRVRGNK